MLGLQPDCVTNMLQGAVLLGGWALKNQHMATTSTAAAILGGCAGCRYVHVGKHSRASAWVSFPPPESWPHFCCLPSKPHQPMNWAEGLIQEALFVP